MNEAKSVLTFEQVAEVLRIIDAAPRGGEITVQFGDYTLHVVSTAAHGSVTSADPIPPNIPSVSPQPAGLPPGPSLPTTTALPAAPGPVPPKPVSVEIPAVAGAPNLVTVESPMTGIFYTSPSPGARPFVSVGDRVGEHDQLCIIEVMKLMNSIDSPSAGIIREVCAVNEALVELGAPLFRIERT